MPFSQLPLFYDTGKQDSCQSLRSSSFQARGTEPCHLPMPSEFQHPELPGNCARHRPIGGPGASWLRAMKTGVRSACHRPYRRSQRRLRQLCMRSTQGEPRSNPRQETTTNHIPRRQQGCQECMISFVEMPTKPTSSLTEIPYSLIGLVILIMSVICCVFLWLLSLALIIRRNLSKTKHRTRGIILYCPQRWLV